MNITHYLKPGDICVSKEPALYKTILGSCISICIHDARLKSGGMNHFIYATANRGKSSDFYGDISSENLIKKMIASGSNPTDLVAGVFGGGTGFPESEIESPGSRNIKIVDSILKKWGIPVLQADTGGNYGRILLFQTDSNSISVEKMTSSLRDCFNVPI